MDFDTARRPSSSPPPAESGVQSKVVPPCQHALYERWVEDHRFARAQCLRCAQCWVEVDISMDPELRGQGLQPLHLFELEGDELGLKHHDG